MPFLNAGKNEGNIILDAEKTVVFHVLLVEHSTPPHLIFLKMKIRERRYIFLVSDASFRLGLSRRVRIGPLRK